MNLNDFITKINNYSLEIFSKSLITNNNSIYKNNMLLKIENAFLCIDAVVYLMEISGFDCKNINFNNYFRFYKKITQINEAVILENDLNKIKIQFWEFK